MSPSDFNKKIIEILSRVEYLTEKNLDEAVRKIELMIRYQFKSTTSLNPWYSNQALKKQIEQILTEAVNRVVRLTQDAITGIWELADKMNDERVFKKLLTATGVTVAAERILRYLNRVIPKGIDPGGEIRITAKFLEEVKGYPRNNEALKAFLNRKVDGLNLSARVWNIANEQVIPLIESKLAAGLVGGTSADQLSREVRSYLRNPDALFRRVRDVKTGKLKLSLAAEAYHPGAGVYRSSYMNAKRLTASETNFAYRSADHERWKGLDFIVGIDIRRSANNKGPCVLCDSLVGRYPKDYFHTGNHPFCICVATPILMEEDDFISLLTTDEPVKVEQTALPDGFKTWIRENAAKLNGNSAPYFARYNTRFVKAILKK